MKGFLRYRLLRNIFLITLLITVLLPAYSAFVAYPGFRDLLAGISEDDASRVAAYVAGRVDVGRLDGTRARPASDADTDWSHLRESLQLLKINIYDREGKVVFSSEPDAVGRQLADALLVHRVLQGEPTTRIVESGDDGGEAGRRAGSAVAEIFVPIEHRGEILGLAEVHQDIAQRKASLDALLTRSTVFLFGMAAIMLVIVMVMLSNLAATIGQREAAEEELSRHKDNLEELVAERTAELERAVRELESFSYTVSHDLRSPLRAIDGFSHALLEDHGDSLDPRAREHIRRVRGASQRMGALIDDLLMLSRISRRQMSCQPVDLSAIAMEVAAVLKDSNPDRQVEVNIQRELRAVGDPHLLRIALENLLGNAFKYTGNATLAQIEVGCTRANGDRAFFVQDNGVGFDVEYGHKLFRPFERLHTNDGFEGTGIGLATVARIIERHGGRVWAEAVPGRGASFYFTLPDAPASPA